MAVAERTASTAKVLVRERIGDSGVDLLRNAGFDVEIGTEWSDEELARRIGEFDGILIRSGTQLDAGLIDRADHLKIVGRAGVGVDNVDVDAATKRGVVVANAPQSNVITAAEHTMAMLLALARKIPQAHSSLTGGNWERTKFSGVELYEKTLGVLGFGRIGQLVAQRALGFGMHVVAFGPFLPLSRDLGRIAVALAEATSIDALEIEYLGRIAERDTRLLTVQVLKGALSGHIEEEVNDVNAPGIARERGIEISETSSARARDFTDLVRVNVVGGGARSRVVGTTLGRQHRPHLLEAWGSRFNIQLEPNLAVFRYVDQPGMIGRVGTLFGKAGINISAAAVGRRPDADHVGGVATMLVTTDSPVPQDVVDRIVESDGFEAGRTVSL